MQILYYVCWNELVVFYTLPSHLNFENYKKWEENNVIRHHWTIFCELCELSTFFPFSDRKQRGEIWNKRNHTGKKWIAVQVSLDKSKKLGSTLYWNVQVLYLISQNLWISSFSSSVQAGSSQHMDQTLTTKHSSSNNFYI